MLSPGGEFPTSAARRPRHGDVDGAQLDRLVAALDGEPIAFSLSADRTWSAMSLSGELRAHADTLGELVEQLLDEVR